MTIEAVPYGSTLPDGYRPRLIDAQLRDALKLFGAVEVAGTKWCGKSWSSLALGESITHVDDPRTQLLIANDPAIALEGASPHVIDEWQEVPSIWDAARRAIDASGSRRGMFILTGSSTPNKELVTHSGAGRIARLRMSTMTLWELGLSTGEVSLSGLFDGRFHAAATEGSLLDIARHVCCGGWPALAGEPAEVVSRTVDQYLDALFEVSAPKRGGTPDAAGKILQSLARNVATPATLNTIAADVAADSSEVPTTRTISHYLDIFKELYVLEELDGWDAPVRAKTRVRTKPKRYFADPSIPATLLGVSPERLLQDGQTLGLLFESLCIHDLKTYVAAMPEAHARSLRYYRDSDDLEVDAIIELRDGRWAGIEIKLGEEGVAKGVDNLNRLRRKIAANPSARNPKPEFMAVLTGVSPFARYDRENDVYVFPITALRE